MAELELHVEELAPMRVAAYRWVGENPEGPALDELIAWASERGLLVKEKRPRFYGFNNPSPSEGDPVYGFEVWIVIDEETEVGDDAQGGDAVSAKRSPGGLYAILRTTPEAFFEGAWGRVHKHLGSWLEENRYTYDGDRQWLEGHVPDLDRLAEFPQLDGASRWIAMDICLPIKPAGARPVPDA